MLINESGYVTLRGVEHFYEWVRYPSAKAKPVMIFVHGWGGSARYWRSTAQVLAQEFDCLLYDLRGFGRSTKSVATGGNNSSDLGYEMRDYAEDLLALLDYFQLEKIYLKAHSMGASIATYFMNLYPDRVWKGILVCNGIFEYDERAFQAFYKFGEYVVRFRYNWFLKVPYSDKLFMSRFLVRSIPSEVSKSFLEDFLQADYESAIGTIYTSVSKSAVEMMPQEFAKLSIPTLLIAGQKDKITPAKLGYQASQLNPLLEYIEIPETAHFPMLEDAPTYLRIVRSFLGEL